MDERTENQGSWTLLTGHGHVLGEIARDPTARIRDIAAAAGVTERTAQSIVADLEAAGYLTRKRVGRRAVYTVNAAQPFRHQSQDGHLVGPFLALLAAQAADTPGPPRPAARKTRTTTTHADHPDIAAAQQVGMADRPVGEGGEVARGPDLRR